MKKTEPYILFFTVHKAASVFIHEICLELSELAGLRHYSPNLPLQSSNYFPEDLSISNNVEYWINRKGCIGPLRFMVDALLDLDSIPILHLRDPRDGLTSMFYSFVYSHPRKRGFNPTDETVMRWIDNGIDKFVMERAPQYLSRYKDYCDKLLLREGTVFVKYEDMVNDLDKWLGQIIGPFNIDNKDLLIKKLSKKHNTAFNVKKEDKYKHIRKVTPGDHKEKLKKDTILQLNEMFNDVLIQLDYEME